jgi:succinate dehydrogenase / fumarate reductase cytochrome b subunit
MSHLPDNSPTEAGLPLVSKCRSKNGAQASTSGAGGCGCKRGGKLRFFLQRVSAVVILALLAFHLLTLRNWGPWSAAEVPRSGSATAADGPTTTAFASTVRQLWDFLPSAGPSPLRFAVAVFYLLATLAVIYHLANGFWTGAIAWGLTPSASAQQRSLWACTAFGIILAVLGLLGWYAFIAAP